VEEAARNWIEVDGLSPDTDYSYTVSVGGTRIGAARFRTWPARATKLAYFVIGD
jgi:phosphodiesterase/alkaline phosphatase D-like protein